MNALKKVSILAVAIMGYGLLAARPGDVMSDLNIDIPKLRQDVLSNLKQPTGFFFNPTVSIRQMAKRLPESSRAATVAALGKSVRAFVESSVFKQAWLQDVRSVYPYDDAYSDEKLAQKEQDSQVAKAALGKQLSTMDQAFAQMDPAMLQMAIRAQLSREEQELASLSGSDQTKKARHVADLKKMLGLPPVEFKKQYVAYIQKQALGEMNASLQPDAVDKEQLAQYRRQKVEFDAHADFKPLLKKRLQDFIALSETVDFEARLIPMRYKQEFANPVYQHKPAEWKFLYRMGKEPVAEARAFAQKWLADLK